jgi:hypothetical protein
MPHPSQEAKFACLLLSQNALAFAIGITYNASTIPLSGVDWGYLKTVHNAEGCRCRSVSERVCDL